MHLIQASFLSKEWGDPQIAVRFENVLISLVAVPVLAVLSVTFKVTVKVPLLVNV